MSLHLDSALSGPPRRSLQFTGGIFIQTLGAPSKKSRGKWKEILTKVWPREFICYLLQVSTGIYSHDDDDDDDDDVMHIKLILEYKLKILTMCA